jgi:hypothetical protein
VQLEGLGQLKSGIVPILGLVNADFLMGLSLRLVISVLNNNCSPCMQRPHQLTKTGFNFCSSDNKRWRYR